LPENHEGRQIVVAPNWIGDTAMAAPFFASLRAAYPGDRIEALATPWSAGILDTFPWALAWRRPEDWIRHRGKRVAADASGSAAAR
jgi:hypothetical protein